MGSKRLKVTESLVRKGGLEPPRFYPPDPKSGASANSATFATPMDYTERSLEGLGRSPKRVTGAALAVAQPIDGQNHTPLQSPRFRCATARNPQPFTEPRSVPDK